MIRLPSSCLRRSALTYINGVQGRHVLPNLARLPHWPRVQHKSLHSDSDVETGSDISASTSTSIPPSSLSSMASPSPPSNTPEELQSQQDAAHTPDPDPDPDPDPNWESFKNCFHIPSATDLSRYMDGEDVVLHGFLGKRRDGGSSLTFCDVQTGSHSIQIVSTWNEEGSLQHIAHQDLRAIPSYSPVCVTGTLVDTERTITRIDHPPPMSLKTWDLRLRSIQCLNPFPKDIIVSKDAVWPLEQRHLQMRFDPLLRQRLYLRSIIVVKMRKYLRARRLLEVETPLLFKSTPEGAREFIVPTRRQGYAYALPQSPQQYKQILMAGGFTGYFQFAKCFRDEDHRADRQPEFTQLDIELSFATGADVMRLVEDVMVGVFKVLHERFTPVKFNGGIHPVYNGEGSDSKIAKKPEKSKVLLGGQEPQPTEGEEKPRYRKIQTIPRMSYDYAMAKFGSDKPDLRINRSHVSFITRIEQWVTEDFIRMITNLETPIVEAVKFRFGSPESPPSPEEAEAFVREFMETVLPSTPALKLAPGSTPGVLVFDSGKPLQGFAALGHEAGALLANRTTSDWLPCQNGDVIIIHARPRDVDELGYSRFRGAGSTELGRLRAAIHGAAVAKGLVRAQPGFRPVWVYKFPLFTPNEGESGEGEGQGGAAGFSSTHHPFTAPLTAMDLELLRTDPLSAKADHYDLVINGVEVGGGSRRIHVAAVQEYVMRSVLRMDEDRVAQFAHLLEALRAGCPPHAGFAFGFDRLVAVLCDVSSVRDVIAFPKNNRGEDPLVRSPSPTTPEQERTYNLSRTE